MKGYAVIFAALFVCVVGNKLRIFDEESELSDRQQRIVTDAISSVINDLRLAIVEAGLDPLDIPRAEAGYSFPEEGILEAYAYAEDVRSTGLSNIVINRLNFAVLTTRLTFEFELPRVEASVGDAEASAVVFKDFNLRATGSGNIALRRVRLSGDVRVSVGIISGISIRSLSLDFSLGGIDSDLNVVILDHDVSDGLNNFLGTSLPASLESHRAQINQLLEIIALRIIEEFL